MSDDVAGMLIRARARIADEEHWTRYKCARDAQGWPVHPYSPGAAQWCANGALLVEYSPLNRHDVYRPAYQALVSAAQDLYGSGGPAAVNDNLGHVAVLRVFDYAIERQREQS